MGKLRDLMVSVCLCMNTVRVARAQAACACGAKGTGVCLAMNLSMHTHKHRHIHTDKVSNWQKTAAANQKMHVNIPIMIWPTGNHGTLNNLAPS